MIDRRNDEQQIIRDWFQRLAGLLQTPDGAAPELRQAGRAGEAAADPTLLWWRCSPPAIPRSIWIGALESSWRRLGEILAHSTPDTDPQRAYVALLGKSWNASGVVTDGTPSIGLQSIEITLPFGDEVQLLLGFDASAKADSNADGIGQGGPALDVLLGMELPVTVRFGHAQKTLDSLIGLKTGSLIGFDHTLEAPVELVVNGRVVARGQVVAVRGSYGVRILEVASRQERFQTGSSIQSDQWPDSARI